MRKKTERCEYERTTPSSFASTYISDVCARRHGFYVEKNKKKRRRVGHALKVFFLWIRLHYTCIEREDISADACVGFGGHNRIGGT